MTSEEITNWPVQTDITDCPVSGLQRKALFTELLWNVQFKRVSVRAMVVFFKNGEPVLDNLGINSYYKEIVATNDFKVDPQGNVIPPEQWDETSMGEYDFYEMVATNVQVNIKDMVIANILQADASGKFN